MRITVITAVLLVWVSGTLLAQTAEDLTHDAATPHNVLTLGMGYGLQRYSPLVQVNKESVKRLVPTWNYSLADTQGQESQPLV